MDEDTFIKVEHLSKKFCRNLKKSLWYGAKDLVWEIAGQRRGHNILRNGEFWALNDVSFEVKRGEMLGLIGQNGAGKSTLLKVLNGLITPDSGKVTIKGCVQALIELGAGFSPILTGRENVYINASVLGISKTKIDQTLPYIVEFAGISEFMESPVQSYSSGMKARLGFAVITQLDPDILLIDEVLAVGDTAFQEKCMRRMDELRQSNKAIIFVTHSLYQVEALCNKALWLDRGRVVQYGVAGDVVRAYLDNQERLAIDQSQKEGKIYEGHITLATKAYFEKRSREGKGGALVTRFSNTEELIQIRKVEVSDGCGKVGNEFPFLTDLTIRIYYYALARVTRPLFNLRFFSKGYSIFEASMLIDGHGLEWVEGEGIVECTIPALPLTPKLYEIKLFVRSGEGICDVSITRTIAQFRITDDRLERVPLRGPMAVNHMRQGSPVYFPRIWKFYDGDGITLLKKIEAGYDHES